LLEGGKKLGRFGAVAALLRAAGKVLGSAPRGRPLQDLSGRTIFARDGTEYSGAPKRGCPHSLTRKRANRWFHQHRRRLLYPVYRGADRFAGQPIAMMARTTATPFASPPGKLAQGAVRLQQWCRSKGAEASRGAEKRRNRSKPERLR
jgi:hypothetical protein